jgi:hypothetical protein
LDNPVALDNSMRQRLERLADVLIPAGDGHLSASEAGVAGPLLDKLLTLRPDILPDIANALQEVGGEDPHRALSGLRERSPRAFDLLTATVATAYFMHPDVRSSLDYLVAPSSSQGSPDAFDDEDRALLEPVKRRGHIYRRVPLEAWMGGSAEAETKGSEPQ